MGDVRHTFIVEASASDVFDHLTNLEHLPRQLASFFEVQLLSSGSKIVEQGHEYSWDMTRFGLRQHVKISVDECIRNEKLSYRQLAGVFRVWRHVIQISAHTNISTRVTDTIHYKLPFGLLGHVLDDLYWNRDLKSILEARSKSIQAELERKSI